MPHARIVGSLAVLSGLLLALAACTTEGDEQATEGTPAATAGGANIEVSLSEFAIEMPESVPAGVIAFDVGNVGSMPHNFEIEGESVEEVLPEDVQPGDSATLEVELAPGTYTVYCPIGNHREQGMERQLEVTGG
jgi:uncharacterized cupredoxin-like copper-binding protein